MYSTVIHHSILHYDTTYNVASDVSPLNRLAGSVMMLLLDISLKEQISKYYTQQCLVHPWERPLRRLDNCWCTGVHYNMFMHCRWHPELLADILLPLQSGEDNNYCIIRNISRLCIHHHWLTTTNIESACPREMHDCLAGWMSGLKCLRQELTEVTISYIVVRESHISFLPCKTLKSLYFIWPC